MKDWMIIARESIWIVALTVLTATRWRSDVMNLKQSL